MSPRSLLSLMFLAFLQRSTGQSYIDGFRSTGDCFKDFPSLTKRFSWEQLEFFCQQKRAYDEIIFANDSLAVSQYFTRAHIDYFDSLSLQQIVNSSGGHPPVIRKEIRRLSEAELKAFLWGLRRLKFSRIDGVSKYDLLVMLSHPALAPGAHVGAAFLPWHREYLRMFELAMRNEEPLAALPYWDSTLDEGLPDPVDSVIWADFLFGSVRGPVVTGVAKFWYFAGFNQSQSSVLTRNVSEEGRPINRSLEEFFLSRRKMKMKDLTACLDLTVEQSSRSLHEWVGGTMKNLYYSPQDFTFFLHHAYLDYLWEKFRQSRQTPGERASDYPSNYESCTKFHYGQSRMRPFPQLRNIDGLSDVYTTRYYHYQDSPNCSQSCDPPYLFCHRGIRCLSKVLPGGNCTGLGISACFDGQCVSGICAGNRSTVTLRPLKSNTEDLSPEMLKNKNEEPHGNNLVEKVNKKAQILSGNH